MLLAHLIVVFLLGLKSANRTLFSVKWLEQAESRYQISVLVLPLLASGHY